MLRSAVILALFAAPAAGDLLTSENEPVKVPVWPTSVEKLLLGDEQTPGDFEEDAESRRAALIESLPGFTTLENYPNPLINPMACRRGLMGSSYVCDPDRVLSGSELDRIEDRLAQIRNNSSHRCGETYVSYEFAVAIVQELPYGVDASTFATELLDRWGLGHSKCHDGVLLLYSADGGEVTLKWKQGVEPFLNYKIYGAILRDFRRNSSRFSAGKAIDADVVIVGQHLTGEILPARQTPHLAVVLGIASMIGIAYLACAATVISDEIAKYR